MLLPLARHANRLPNDAVFKTGHSELNMDVPAFQQQNRPRPATYDKFSLGSVDRRMLRSLRIRSKDNPLGTDRSDTCARSQQNGRHSSLSTQAKRTRAEFSSPRSNGQDSQSRRHSSLATTSVSRVTCDADTCSPASPMATAICFRRDHLASERSLRGYAQRCKQYRDPYQARMSHPALVLLR